MTKAQLEKRCAKLERALRALVYRDGNRGWYTGIIGDTNVDDIIGKLLDETKSKRT